MKKIMAVIASLMCAVVLASCGGAKEDIKSDIDVTAVAGILDETVHFSEELTEISQDVILRRYGLDASEVDAAAGYAGTQAVVDEIAVFKTSDTDAVLDAVNARLDSQKTNYASYAPDEVPKLDNAVCEAIGGCVIVCVSEEDSAVVSDIIAQIMENI